MAVALLAACSGGPDEETADTRPNLVLLSIDCLRADHLRCYGYERETSPTIDRLAKEGVRFERCLSTTSWTLPAHLSMLMGLPLSAHGVDDDRLWTRIDGEGQPVPVPLKGVFLSELLESAGYDTAGFVTWKYLEDQFGFGPGFDVYERLAHTFYSHPEVGPAFEAAQEAGDTEAMKALFEAHPQLFDDTSPTAPEVFDRAMAWLDQREGDEPFFLFLHVFDCHDPYSPPEPYARMFDPEYTGTIDGRRVTAPDSPVHKDMDARDLEHLVARYDGAIRFVDAELERWMNGLAERGFATNTLHAITADHGEEFFEHGGKTHRSSLYMESVGVPLVLHWPDGLEAGHVIAGNSGIIDLLPTFCSAAGVESVPPNMGTDLLPIARGEVTNGKRLYLSELTLFGQGAAPDRLLSLVRGDEQTVARTRGQAAWQAARIDLGADPLGRGFGEPTSQVELDALREGLRHLRTALPDREAGEPLDAGDLADLAAMGYGGHDGPIEGEDHGDRLILDGGVWPDE